MTEPPSLIGLLATRAASALATENVVVIAIDDVRASAVAAALAAAAPAVQVLLLPTSDALPGETAPASPANTGMRMAALRGLRVALAAGQRVAFVTTAEAAIVRQAPPDAFDAAPPEIAVGDAVDVDGFTARLAELGYVFDDRIDEPGEIGVHGAVIDIYPVDAPHPVRIELGADNRVVAIRGYDPLTQLSASDLTSIELGRAAEVRAASGAVPLLAHVPGFAVLAEPGMADRQRRFRRLVADDLAARQATVTMGDLLVDDQTFAAERARRTGLDLPTASESGKFATARSPLRAAARAIADARGGGRRTILVGSERDLRFLRPRLARALKRDPVVAGSWAEALALPADSLATVAMPIPAGWQDDDMLVIAAADLLGSRALATDAAAVSVASLALVPGDIHIGDVVVHEDHGIARVAAIEPLADGQGDAIVLEHAREARRLVPVSDAFRLWRYGADADAVALDTLDGGSWEKRRDEVAAAIAETARELTRLATERSSLSCPEIDPDAAAYEAFVAGFPYEPTHDQTRAIDAIRSDLRGGRPVDRLVVGDVGYGKTEVALRAAALAALAGRQVIVAAPTTVLVRQHLETFRSRFAATGVTVAGLSRLSTPAEAKATRAGLADGSIGIVIGTAAVAGKAVRYKDVALVVIDEEQRFGSADKTRLRNLTPQGHVLTLSATPIPRTLQMALVGLQAVSVIATPPARRQPIRTTVAELDDRALAAALIREHGRRGQSFIVVPRIEDMDPMAERLARIVPQLTTRIAHGKLTPAEIDTVMVDFAAGSGDVLLATNIIEAGLDVPRANTMIVHRADRFGLSQLHQLRGRVGRGARRGQILLFTDPAHPIAPATLRRLKALEAFDRLGAGFAISARDLDMRGAGDLVGEAQAGHMKLLGVDLAQHLLEQALRAARGEDVDEWVPQLNLGIAGGFPAEWLPDPDIRLALYIRLSRCRDGVALDTFEAELEDRFGAIPATAQTAIAVARARASARAANIARIDAGPAAIAFTPRAAGPAPAPLIAKDDRWLWKVAIEDPAERLDALVELLADM